MHTIAGALDHAILIIDIASGNRALRPRLPTNDAFKVITGYSEAEVPGRNCAFMQGQGTDPNVVASIREALRNHNEFAGEILKYRKDGSAFWNDLTISPVVDETGALSHFVGVTPLLSMLVSVPPTTKPTLKVRSSSINCSRKLFRMRAVS
jgi:PAS domain-containing protein